ncbi:MAG: zinc ribbon domain-containing protein [Gemmatimonadota bacterium]|nr:MAG: zinc ribbon domain-containing protein [Gemmatimonadota bacterium]
MALIDCPQCGHKVLSVASTCPECGFSLSEQRKRDSHMSRAAICRQCHKEIAASSQLCPHCGEKKPVARAPKWLVPTIVTVVLVIAVFFFPWPRSERSEQQFATQVADSQPDLPVQDTAMTTPPASQTEPITPQPAVAPEPETQTKWTRDWANIRAERSVGSEVVDILEPGDQIEVADLQGSWWAVYVNGRRYGYISASLVADEPPMVEPDTGAAGVPLTRSRDIPVRDS